MQLPIITQSEFNMHGEYILLVSFKSTGFKLNFRKGGRTCGPSNL